MIRLIRQSVKAGSEIGRPRDDIPRRRVRSRNPNSESDFGRLAGLLVFAKRP
jgi:hypothetical protein